MSRFNKGFQFTTYEALEKHLISTFADAMSRSKDIDDVLASAMSQAVYDVVYNHFEPELYVRRKDMGGLSDPLQMGITQFGIYDDGRAFIVFENLAEGDDNLQGETLTDTIVEGIESNWSKKDGPWTDPRDFVRETAVRLRENPKDLLNAFRKALIEYGLNVR